VQTSEPEPTDDKSLPRLLLELLWQVMVLGVPIFLVTCLPPLLGLLIVLMCATLMVLGARLGSQPAGRFFARLMTGAVFGLGFSLGRTLPEYWNLVAALVSIVGGLACTSSLERRLGLAKAKPADEPIHGASAWGGGEPAVTPEGEPIRVFNFSEIAMGGPTYCDYLFSDGVLLQGIGSSARFSTDGRYFAAPVPSRQSWSLVILDRQLRRLYSCNNGRFWELDEFNEQGLRGRHSPLVDNSTQQVSLEELLRTSKAVDLVAVADLWLAPGQWQEDMANALIEYRAPTDDLRVEGHLAFPASLRALPQPTDPLRYPEYRLSLDGEASAMLIHGGAPLIWNPNGKAFACFARKEDQSHGGYWYFSADDGWRQLPQPWIASSSEPSLSWEQPLALDGRSLWIMARFDYAQPDCGAYGYGLHSIHSDTETQIGHDPQGRMQVAELPLTRMRLAVPLAGNGLRGTSSVESAPLLNNQRARLDWQHDNSEGLGAYLCTLGDWQLPGLWLLDHRASDCSRYLALVPFSEPPAVPGHVVVVDVRERRLLQSPPLLVGRLLDFRGPRLTLAAIYGRLDRKRQTTPLQRFNQPAPDATNAAQFCRYQDSSRLYYQTVELHVEAAQLRQSHPWRQVDRPQAAIADGAFIQPSPDNQDAAWLFGSETEYADSWLRSDSARTGGHLLTASGCAMRDLAPSMIWSPGGRYLALTRFHPDPQDPNTDRRREWQLLVLDIQERSLHTYPQWLGNRAEFVSFDNDKVRIRVFELDWEQTDEPDTGSVQSIPVSAVLETPAEALVEHDGLWLPADQLGDTALWIALDKSPLDQWTQASKP
jgi:hypothetical protein